MSLYQAIEHNKEHRKQYRKSKLWFKSCRNHGKCEWCSRQRQYNTLRKLEQFKIESYEERESM